MRRYMLLFFLAIILTAVSLILGCAKSVEVPESTTAPEQLYYDIQLQWENGQLELYSKDIRLIKGRLQNVGDYTVSVIVDNNDSQANIPAGNEEPFHLYINYTEDGQKLSINDLPSGKPLLDTVSLPQKTRWQWILAIASLIVLVGLIGFIIVRKTSAKRRIPIPPPAPPAAAILNAKLLMPGNIEIPLPTATRQIGRGDLARAVAAEDLRHISKQHLTIDFSNGQYYVEDTNSTNGTKVNGVEIKAKEKLALKNNDRIEIADVIVLTFREA